MSDSSKNFIELAISGDALLEEVDDFVDRWHDSDSELSLRDYLGMFKDEYALWLGDPSYLGLIVAARSNRLPLIEAVNDNYADLSKLAARSSASVKIKRLKIWLAEQEKIALA